MQDHLKKIWTGPETGNPRPIIYLGGIVAGRGGEKALSLYPDIVRYQCLSYFYFEPGKMEPEVCQQHLAGFTRYHTRCFLDSGAFSYQIDGIKKGRPLDQRGADQIIDSYAKWVLDCPFVFDFIVTFDYQRDARIEAWATKRLESYGLHPVPTYHYGSSLTVLRGLIHHGYSFIGIGGMVGTPRAKLLPFLDQVFNITVPQNIRLHGFGVGGATMMFGYPWFCVDSTTWLAAAGKGGQVVRRSLDPQKIVEVVSVSPRSSAFHHKDGDSREARIRETWLTYDSLMTNPPAKRPSKRGLF